MAIHVDKAGIGYWNGDKAEMIGHDKGAHIVVMRMLEGCQKGGIIDLPVETVLTMEGKQISKDELNTIFNYYNI